jgi:pyruvate/2-oxoglutarate dehydrogenase complex dihydrolipoamide acyltransferase (E2) component
MALIEVKVPDIGDFKDVAVIELLVKEGDAVKAEQGLVTVESDKASMEIPSSHAGVVKELKVKIGDKGQRGVGCCARGVGAAAGLARRLAGPAPRPPAAHRGAGPGARATRGRRSRVRHAASSAPARAAIRPPSAPPTSA